MKVLTLILGLLFLLGSQYAQSSEFIATDFISIKTTDSINYWIIP